MPAFYYHQMRIMELQVKINGILIPLKLVLHCPYVTYIFKIVFVSFHLNSVYYAIIRRDTLLHFHKTYVL